VKRREFVTLLGSAAVAWPLAARAQQQAIPVIGFLGSASAELWAERLRVFRQGLGETGYVEGQNVAIEYRWTEGHNDRLPAMAADLVARQVTVIIAPGNTAAVLAAKAATATVPIVFVTGVGPVELGLVPSLSRPGGNLTGVTTLNVELASKRLELLHEVVPAASVVALLINPTNLNNAEAILRDTQAAARSLGLRLHVLHASTERDFEGAFASASQLKLDAVVIGSDALFSSRSEQLGALTQRHALPAIFSWRAFVAAGGLMSYGTSFTDPFRLAGVYAGRIMKGEKPADLPVQQSTKVELIINLKTAKALGVTVPLPLLGRADELIE
jgi:putative ABC transport system substrate-binding protein